ncbi:MAG TPA: hypothetical protein VE129_02670 [Thermoanaerobaculia bacterium]|nr:hypothetical protein [Thermoanaerobaculia bacterium]
MSDAPEVSVVVAVYLSETTLSGFLDVLGRQAFRNFETILVDSGPTGACARVVAARLPYGNAGSAELLAAGAGDWSEPAELAGLTWERRTATLLEHLDRNYPPGETASRRGIARHGRT